MAQFLSGNSATVTTGSRWTRSLVGVLLLLLGVSGHESAQATTGINPYEVPEVCVTGDGRAVCTTFYPPNGNTVEVSLTAAATAAADIGNGVSANVVTFNGTIPGPTFRLNVGDLVIVHFTNNLSLPTSIHWHGVELNNASDGTPLVQDPVAGSGGTFDYEFIVTRPGTFWYHPHFQEGTNQVFQGLYGAIHVADPYEAQLQAMGILPPTTQTHTVVLSDITVCKATNDTVTYDPALPHVSGNPLGANRGPSPEELCQTNPIGGVPFGAGDVPNIQKAGSHGPVGEGQTVLTNGMNVGGRAGTPANPGALDAGAGIPLPLDVQAGQGRRLQIVNASTTRYVRLLMTINVGSEGMQIPLVRVGGQGGLLDNAALAGGVIKGFDFKYGHGEILIPPGSREDVVAVIPMTAAIDTVATIWTQDFQRSGAGYTQIPTVPVMHLKVTGAAGAPYMISAGTALRKQVGGNAKVEGLNAPGHSELLHPTAIAEIGATEHIDDIWFTNSGSSLGVDGVLGEHADDSIGHAAFPPIPSARHARLGDTLELTVTNMTGAHHPFHLHGFSIQPISLTDEIKGDPPAPNGPNCSPGQGKSYKFAQNEFLDNIDIPCGYTLTFRVRLDDRPKVNGDPGGGLGRWFLHCHILFHANFGMISELVVHPATIVFAEHDQRDGTTDES